MKTYAALLALVMTGCITVNKPPEIEATKQWEGHFFTVEEFQKGTESIKLGKNESVWVLSDRTLARVLKNCIQNKTGK